MHFERMSVTYAGPGIMGARLVDIVWEGLLARAQAPARWRPPIDIYEADNVLHVVVDIAGVEPDNLSLHLFDDALVIEGERRWTAPRALERVDAAEIRYGAFAVPVPVPADVDPARVRTSYERGLLEVTLPRRRRGG